MKRSTRRQLDTLQRVRHFSEEHPSPVEGYVAALRQLGAKLDRAEALAAQQESGDLEAGASGARKDELREVIEADYVDHLVRIARAAFPQDGEVRRRFRRPPRKVNRQEFVASVRAMLAEAAAHRALFIGAGMAETFVEELEARLAEYLAAISQKNLGEARRVGAVAELPEIVKELMALVRQLDAINRKRWQKSPELLAAWRSAKDVSWPHGKPTDPDAGGGRASAA